MSFDLIEKVAMVAGAAQDEFASMPLSVSPSPGAGGGLLPDYGQVKQMATERSALKTGTALRAPELPR